MHTILTNVIHIKHVEFMNQLSISQETKIHYNTSFIIQNPLF